MCRKVDQLIKTVLYSESLGFTSHGWSVQWAQQPVFSLDVENAKNDYLAVGIYWQVRKQEVIATRRAVNDGKIFIKREPKSRLYKIEVLVAKGGNQEWRRWCAAATFLLEPQMLLRAARISFMFCKWAHTGEWEWLLVWFVHERPKASEGLVEWWIYIYIYSTKQCIPVPQPWFWYTKNLIEKNLEWST